MKPLGMANKTLRRRVLEALFEGHYGYPHDPMHHSDFSGWLHDEADAVLAALGLDDVEAAIERAAWVLVDTLPGHGTPIHDLYGPAAERALRAALTATPESENADA